MKARSIVRRFRGLFSAWAMVVVEHAAARPRRAHALVAFCVLLPVSAAHAGTFRVGAPVGAGQCTHADVQSAIVAAAANPGPDTILVTRSIDYTHQALTIHLPDGIQNDVTLAGGYVSCAQSDSDGIKTVLDGAGGATDPVLRAHVGKDAQLLLRHLTLRGGDEDGTGYGGGIDFDGAGRLRIEHATISGNLAGYGGGIYVEGALDGFDVVSELSLGEGVEIVGNSARRSGGGVYLENATLRMLELDSYIALNEARGEGGEGGGGGGLMILSSNHGTTAAYIGSGGAFGAIYGNQAVHGGGVAIANNDYDGDAKLFLFGTAPGRPAAVRANSASTNGGGIYLSPYITWSASGGFRGPTAAYLWYADVDDNAAAQGAAIYAGHDESLDQNEGGRVYINTNPPAGAIRCPDAAPCTRIANNHAHNGAAPTEGAIFHGSSATVFDLRNARIEDNKGGRIFAIDGENEPLLKLRDSTLLRNETSLQLLHVRGEDPLVEIDGVTFADNIIGGTHVFDLGDEVGLRFDRSILWQPGSTSLTGGEDIYVNAVVASETASFGTGQDAFVANPRFVDPARGDYSLRAASPAVDHAAGIEGNDRDLHNVLRDLDLACVPNVMGPRDLGAWERPDLLPLLLNTNFDNGLNLWSNANANTAFDGALNATGGAGSGSAHVSQTAPAAVTRAFGASQCIHLPSPGHYTLNGYGRSIGTSALIRDVAVLHWQLRYDGGEQCNAGLSDSSGFHSLGRATSFFRPDTPAAINVPEDRWTTNTSLTVVLVAEEGNSISGTGEDHGMSAWFDGITLQLDCDVLPPPDVFRDGFEMP